MAAIAAIGGALLGAGVGALLARRSTQEEAAYTGGARAAPSVPERRCLTADEMRALAAKNPTPQVDAKTTPPKVVAATPPPSAAPPAEESGRQETSGATLPQEQRRGSAPPTTEWDSIEPVTGIDLGLHGSWDDRVFHKEFADAMHELRPAPLAACVRDSSLWKRSDIDTYDIEVVLNVEAREDGRMRIVDAAVQSASVGEQSIEDCYVRTLKALDLRAKGPLQHRRYRFSGTARVYKP